MIDTRNQFQEWVTNNMFGITHANGDYEMVITVDDAEKYWQACQQLNDKRIADLLALVAKKDALINECIENNLYLADGDNCTLKPIIDALALTVDDFELVEVKDYHDMICGAGSLYTIKEKPPCKPT